jgi:hypothetical protein
MAPEDWKMNTTTTTVQLSRGEVPFAFRDINIPAQPPATPSEWFGRRFPAEVKRWGCPFLEEVAVDRVTGKKRITATALNDCFLASTLSDSQLGHSVVFLESEQQWFFLDPHDQLYHSTSETKLTTLLSCLLVRCAEEMPSTVDKVNLFVKFRDDQQLKAVVKKGRAILEADSTFFAPGSPHRRIELTEQPAQTARRFIQSTVKPQPGHLLSVNDCYLEFSGFCRNNGIEPVQRRFFRQLIVDVIKEEFGVCFRSDLRDAEGRFLRGWKGLAVELNTRN